MLRFPPMVCASSCRVMCDKFDNGLLNVTLQLTTSLCAFQSRAREHWTRVRHACSACSTRMLIWRNLLFWRARTCWVNVTCRPCILALVSMILRTSNTDVLRVRVNLSLSINIYFKSRKCLPSVCHGLSNFIKLPEWNFVSQMVLSKLVNICSLGHHQTLQTYFCFEHIR